MIQQINTYLSERKTRKYCSALHQKYREYTMISQHRYIYNLQLAQSYEKIEGAIVECGTWRGGMIAGIAERLGPKRGYYLYDSFEGLPPATEIDGKDAIAWQSDTEANNYYDNCKAEESFAHEAMKLSGATNVKITKGWFSDTLPHYDGPEIAILRLDGDWYESTMQCLENLYPAVKEGGIVILDDYHYWDGFSKAVHEYLTRIESSSRVYQFHDSRLAYIIKQEQKAQNQK
ncbi:MAG: TylF/MycF/NovP-related O-methyltransferase [Bacteroidia bacterium]